MTPHALDATPPRTVRTLGPPDAPVTGRLVQLAPDRSAFLVDRVAAADTPAEGEHVWTALDVHRTDGGHQLVFPALDQRLDRLITRRGNGALSAGECITLGVSAVRALISKSTISLGRGEWWLTVDGQPVLVAGVGERSPAGATEALLSAVAAAARDGECRALCARAAEESVRDAPFRADPQDWEDAFFALGDPCALATVTTAAADARGFPEVPDEDDRSAPPWWLAWTRHIDDRLSRTSAEVVATLRRRDRRPPGRPLFVAGAVVLVVLAGGALWPGGQDTGEADPRTPPTALPSDTAASETPPADSLAALSALVERWHACADAACRDRQSDVALSHGAIAAGDVAYALVEDFGDLAVFRVTADGETAQFVTIVRDAETWRVRDVQDVADPPT